MTADVSQSLESDEPLDGGALLRLTVLAVAQGAKRAAVGLRVPRHRRPKPQRHRHLRPTPQLRHRSQLGLFQINEQSYQD